MQLGVDAQTVSRYQYALLINLLFLDSVEAPLVFYEAAALLPDRARPLGVQHIHWQQPSPVACLKSAFIRVSLLLHILLNIAISDCVNKLVWTVA
jgi:hypothetical protein